MVFMIILDGRQQLISRELTGQHINIFYPLSVNLSLDNNLIPLLR